MKRTEMFCSDENLVDFLLSSPDTCQYTHHTHTHTHTLTHTHTQTQTLSSKTLPYYNDLLVGSISNLITINSKRRARTRTSSRLTAPWGFLPYHTNITQDRELRKEIYQSAVLRDLMH